MQEKQINDNRKPTKEMKEAIEEVKQSINKNIDVFKRLAKK